MWGRPSCPDQTHLSLAEECWNFSGRISNGSGGCLNASRGKQVDPKPGALNPEAPNSRSAFFAWAILVTLAVSALWKQVEQGLVPCYL